MARPMTADSHGGIPGRTVVTGGASSCTRLTITERGLAARNGSVPVNISYIIMPSE